VYNSKSHKVNRVSLIHNTFSGSGRDRWLHRDCSRAIGKSISWMDQIDGGKLYEYGNPGGPTLARAGARSSVTSGCLFKCVVGSIEIQIGRR